MCWISVLSSQMDSMMTSEQIVMHNCFANYYRFVLRSEQTSTSRILFWICKNNFLCCLVIYMFIYIELDYWKHIFDPWPSIFVNTFSCFSITGKYQQNIYIFFKPFIDMLLRKTCREDVEKWPLVRHVLNFGFTAI